MLIVNHIDRRWHSWFICLILQIWQEASLATHRENFLAVNYKVKGYLVHRNIYLEQPAILYYKTCLNKFSKLGIIKCQIFVVIIYVNSCTSVRLIGWTWKTTCTRNF